MLDENKMPDAGTAEDLQTYIDAINEVYPDLTFSIAAAKTGKNSVEIPGSDQFLNFDNPKFKFSANKIEKARKNASRTRRKVQNQLSLKRKIRLASKNLQRYLGDAGYTELSRTDLSLVLMDYTGQYPLGIVDADLRSALDAYSAESEEPKQK